MASQVLSGASNPSYRNNTDQNVRVVINYMSSNANNQLAISWAGVGAGGIYTVPTIIGRNLAHSTVIQTTAQGTTQLVQTGSLRPGQPGFDISLTDQGRAIFTAVATNVDTAVAVSANNASGNSVGLPTELMLAPGQTFSAICAVYNIVVIPENG
jgi:hypothetical protein